MTPKCSICSARSKYSLGYAGRLLCPDCRSEYIAILEGWMSSKELKRRCDVRRKLLPKREED